MLENRMSHVRRPVSLWSGQGELVSVGSPAGGRNEARVLGAPAAPIILSQDP